VSRSAATKSLRPCSLPGLNIIREPLTTYSTESTTFRQCGRIAFKVALVEKITCNGEVGVVPCGSLSTCPRRKDNTCKTASLGWFDVDKASAAADIRAIAAVAVGGKAAAAWEAEVAETPVSAVHLSYHLPPPSPISLILKPHAPRLSTAQPSSTFSPTRHPPRHQPPTASTCSSSRLRVIAHLDCSACSPREDAAVLTGLKSEDIHVIPAALAFLVPTGRDRSRSGWKRSHKAAPAAIPSVTANP